MITVTSEVFFLLKMRDSIQRSFKKHNETLRD